MLLPIGVSGMLLSPEEKVGKVLIESEALKDGLLFVLIKPSSYLVYLGAHCCQNCLTNIIILLIISFGLLSGFASSNYSESLK